MTTLLIPLSCDYANFAAITLDSGKLADFREKSQSLPPYATMSALYASGVAFWGDFATDEIAEIDDPISIKPTECYVDESNYMVGAAITVANSVTEIEVWDKRTCLPLGFSEISTDDLIAEPVEIEMIK